MPFTQRLDTAKRSALLAGLRRRHVPAEPDDADLVDLDCSATHGREPLGEPMRRDEIEIKARIGLPNENDSGSFCIAGDFERLCHPR